MDESFSSMNDEQQREQMESYIARLVSEAASQDVRIATLERVIREAQQGAQQFREENQYLKTELERTKEEVYSLANRGNLQGIKVTPQKPELFHGNRNEDVEGFLVT